MVYATDFIQNLYLHIEYIITFILLNNDFTIGNPGYNDSGCLD